MSLFTRHIIKLIICLDVILAVAILAEQRGARADAACYTAVGRLMGWGEDEHAQLHRPDEPVAMEKVIMRRHFRDYPTVRYVDWDADADMASLQRPKVQELATILSCLSGRKGVNSVGISVPLEWEDEGDEMAYLMFARALQPFSHVCMGLHGRNAAQSEATPEALLSAAIPMAQVEGNVVGLPSANTPFAYHLPMQENGELPVAPDFIEDEPLVYDPAKTPGMSCPLLLRWNGTVLPTLPLRMAMAQLGIGPAEVHVRLGKSLRLGKRILPLDEHGRTPLGAAKAVPLPLTEVLRPQDSLPSAWSGWAVLTRPFSPRQGVERGQLLAATLSLLLAQDSEVYMPTQRPAGNKLMELNFLQATVAGRVLLVCVIICALVWLPQLGRRVRRVVVCGLLVGIITAACLWARVGVWMSLSAWLLSWVTLTLALWILSPREPKPKPPVLWD